MCCSAWGCHLINLTCMHTQLYTTPYCVCVCVFGNWKRGWDGPCPLTIRSNWLGLHYLERLWCFFCSHLTQGHITTNIIVCIIVILDNCMILELLNASGHQGRTQSDPLQVPINLPTCNQLQKGRDHSPMRSPVEYPWRPPHLSVLD